MTSRRPPRRLVLAAIVLTTLATTAACGGDDRGAVSTDPPVITTTATTGSRTTDHPDDDLGIDLGDDLDAPFLELDERFAVTAGGEVYRRRSEPTAGEGFARPAPVMAPLPPLPTGWEVATLTEAGLDQLLATMDELGLLTAPPDYGDYLVTDSVTFDMTVHVDGASYEHSLYYPRDTTGDDEADAARARLTTFIDVVDDLERELGDELGGFTTYRPTQWEIRSVRHGASEELPAWPFTVPADEGCTDFPADEPVRDGDDVASGRYLSDGDAVDVVALLPWQHC